MSCSHFELSHFTFLKGSINHSFGLVSIVYGYSVVSEVIGGGIDIAAGNFIVGIGEAEVGNIERQWCPVRVGSALSYVRKVEASPVRLINHNITVGISLLRIIKGIQYIFQFQVRVQRVELGERACVFKTKEHGYFQSPPFRSKLVKVQSGRNIILCGALSVSVRDFISDTTETYRGVSEGS